MEYSVHWKIDIDADSAEDAARKAHEIQRDPHAFATAFDVSDGDRTEHIDLDQPDTPPRIPILHGVDGFVEIFFEDLVPSKQRELLEYYRVSKPSEANLDAFAIATIEVDFDIDPKTENEEK